MQVDHGSFSLSLSLSPDVEVSYLPHLQLDDAVAVLLKTTADVDICSDPVEVPGGLRIGNIRTPTLSVSFDTSISEFLNPFLFIYISVACKYIYI